MIGIVIELLLSWLLLKYTLQQNLNALNWSPFPKRWHYLLVGFALPLVYLTLLYLGISYWVQNPYHLNAAYGFTDLMKGTYFVFKAVVFEELIFRGAILYLLIHYIGSNKAIFCSALAFGVYHWFSYGVIGQPMPMLIVFLSTGVMGYLWALAFVKTGTILLPFALHLGYNFTSMIIFSNEKNIGPQLLVKTHTIDPVQPQGILPLLIVIVYYVGFPILCLIYLRLLNPKLNTEDHQKNNSIKC